MTIDKILREAEIKSVTGLSRSARWRLVRAGKFPAPVKLSENAIGWRASDIDAWLTSRQPVNYAIAPAA